VTVLSIDHPLRTFLRDVVWEVMPWRTGITDSPTLEYLSNLLTRFASTAELYRFRDLSGRRLEQVAELLAEAEQRLGHVHAARERELHRHIGDFTLFWVGVFPEALPRLQAYPRLDSMLDYVREGRRAYERVSRVEAAAHHDELPIFRRLAGQFELVASGLYATRSEWERRAAESFWGLRASLR
jgi:hypothetical protein